MAVPKRSIRGLQDIRTHSGSVDQIREPYRAYMRVTCLEMEKTRRGRERESAMHRVRNIDARFKEIEAEKDALLEALGERDRKDSADASDLAGETVQQGGREGFKVRY